MADLPLVCPAASSIHPVADEPSVLCGVIEIANDGAAIAGRRDRANVSPVMSRTRMAATVSQFCAGSGLAGSACSYTACKLWRAEKARIAAARHQGPDGLRDEESDRPPTIDPELAEAVRLTIGA